MKRMRHCTEHCTEKIDRIGLSGTRLSVETNETRSEIELSAPDHRTAATWLLDWLAERPEAGSLLAVGHRVVHGMLHSEPARITPELLAELQRISAFDDLKQGRLGAGT